MATKNNYVNNDELQMQMKDYIQTGQISERLGQILIDLHDHILEHKNFRGYRPDLKDEMKSYSLYRIIKRGLRTWDPNRGCKAFSYITRAIFHNYITILARYYSKLNKHQEYVKYQLAKIDQNNPMWKEFAKEFQASESLDVIM